MKRAYPWLALVWLPALMFGACISPKCTGVSAFGNLGPEVNSPLDDYAPALPDTATLVFTTNRLEPGRIGLQDQYRETRPTRLLFSMRLTSSWDVPQPYPLLFGEPTVEAATITFAPEGSAFYTVAYISLCGAEGSVGGCDLYAVTGGEQAGLVNLGQTVNTAGWESQPYVTPDGSRLYFASDRPGGSGKTDIWIADRLPGGAWGAPRNAGPTINSPLDELAPFLDPVTGSLYFAGETTDHGLDIFVVAPSSTERTRLSAPYNSPQDDFTPYVLSGTLYLSSRRTGGCGGYDLYAFPLP